MSDSKKKSLCVAAERENLEGFIRPDFTRPAYSAIRAAFIERFAEYYTLLMSVHVRRVKDTFSSSTQDFAHVNKSSVSAARLARLDRECMALAGLLFDRSNLWAVRDWRKPSIVKFLVRSLKRPQGGRPATKLPIALHVKDLRLTDSKRWTWRNATALFCNCGSKTHGIQCQDNLRREVKHLEKMMKKHQITVPVKNFP